ncbi:UNVERIFIED_CONTAM: hypothetical protein Sindi_1770900 [Sesamum indicum]
MDESSGNTTSSPPSRANCPHDTALSWATRSSDGDEETDFSDMSSDEEKHFMLLYEVLCPSYFRTKQPQHISSLQGSDWKGVLLESQRSRVSVMESVAIFLQTVSLSEHQKTSCKRFQHSLETISRHMKRVSRSLNLLAPELICPTNFNHIHPRNQYSRHLFLYFKDCVGGIDGTLIPASVPVHLQNAYHSRHGEISQNVMVVCGFDLMFTYVMAGWEGSANDARVFMDCLNNDWNFPWPPDSKYYLVDSAYPNFPGFLAPYRQDCYHINSFQGNNCQARGPKELFNQRHSQLRNVIERAFGVLKNRFPILKGPMPHYSVERQRDLVIACCVIHNFIRKFSIADHFFNRGEHGEFDSYDNQANNEFHRLPQQSQEDIDTPAAFRNAMAAHLWDGQGTVNVIVS